jgi:hypothetical protein
MPATSCAMPSPTNRLTDMTDTPPVPFTFGELLRRAWRMYRREPWLFIALAAVTVIPVGLLSAFAGNAAAGQGDLARAGAILGIALIPAILLLPVSGAAITFAVVRRLRGTPVGVGASLERVGIRFWVLFGALALVTLGVFVGLFALVIPGIFLAILWLFAGQAAVIDGTGVTDSLRRSQDLVRGGWWTVFAAFLLIQIVSGVASVALGIVGAGILAPLDGTAQSWGEGAWNIITQLLVQPFTLIAIALLYADRVIRRDGVLPGAST